MDLRSMDLEASVDVSAMASSAVRALTTADVNLLKVILALGLYPQVCDMDKGHAQASFLARDHCGLSLSPPFAVLTFHKHCSVPARQALCHPLLEEDPCQERGNKDPYRLCPCFAARPVSYRALRCSSAVNRMVQPRP
jgi:hypothetical protein